MVEKTSIFFMFLFGMRIKIAEKVDLLSTNVSM